MKLARTIGHHVVPRLRIHIDEAGRGPLAGPVMVGLVMPLHNFPKDDFKDSKLLTEPQRESLYTRILDHEKAGDLVCATGYATNQEIDEHGIIHALHLAVVRGMITLLKKFYVLSRRARLLASPYGEDLMTVLQLDGLFAKRIFSSELLQQILALPHTLRALESVLIDGNHTFHLDEILPCPIITIIKGDQKNPAISMASILAKVERDRLMVRLARHLPSYEFHLHKGYGTQSHREAIKQAGLSSLHRRSFCTSFLTKKKKSPNAVLETPYSLQRDYKKISATSLPFYNHSPSLSKRPPLLLHICCAPDLTWPLHWLKKHFHLHLFWYNPNIHPRQEHAKRYEQFLKLVGLEKGEFDIIEDRYDPKEFFQAMIDHKETIHPSLHNAPQRQVLQVAGDMEEWSDRCNPCYSMRLRQAAKTAAHHGIPYFTSTLLISPKKHGEKLFTRGCDAEKECPSTKFLRFDFAKNEGYKKAVELTRKHSLRRQHYCGCGWTIPKPGEERKGYVGG